MSNIHKELEKLSKELDKSQKEAEEFSKHSLATSSKFYYTGVDSGLSLAIGKIDDLLVKEEIKNITKE